MNTLALESCIVAAEILNQVTAFKVHLIQIRRTQFIAILVIYLGHGFKLSPVIGKILCKLAMGERPSYDLSPFKVYKN